MKNCQNQTPNQLLMPCSHEPVPFLFVSFWLVVTTDQEMILYIFRDHVKQETEGMMYTSTIYVPSEILQPWLLIVAAQRCFDSHANWKLTFQIEAENIHLNSMMLPPKKIAEFDLIQKIQLTQLQEFLY